MKIINYISNLRYSFDDDFRMAWYYIDPFLKYTVNDNDFCADMPHDLMQYQVDGCPFISMGFRMYMQSIAIRLKG
tara:strand:+ start:55 stop:279 length:225 start_codon:yes stop_codon:yes gene_type:complete